MKYLLKLKLHYNFIFLFILISSVKVEEISIEPDYEKIGETSTKYLNKNKEIELYFKGDIKNQILLLRKYIIIIIIHFLFYLKIPQVSEYHL